MASPRLNVWNSLLGWSSILLAGAIYAVLTLAPRIVHWEQLSRDQAAGDERLARLHEQTRQMESIVTALETDPRLLEEIAHAEWRIESASEESIAVEAPGRIRLSQVVERPRAQRDPPAAYVGWLQAVSVDESLRGKLMLAAIALCLIPILSAPRDRGPDAAKIK